MVMMQIIPRPMDSLDQIEMLMVVEQLFGVSIPSKDAEQFASPRDIVDWLDTHLANKKPNSKGIAFLQGLANLYERPAFIENLDGPWRRELIAAIIRALYSDEDPQWLRVRVRQIMQERKGR